jgi:enoyl-[acyl-carrier-protein] reductase (NADH)
MSLIERLFGLKDRVALATWSSAGIGAAIFLSSDAFPFVNGHILYVDGGLTASV